jgi:hypothetical protein
MSAIHDVKLEILRPGTAHNQLLSPNTSYSVLCGTDWPATTITQPLEHRQLLTRLERLRYFSGVTPVGQSQRESELRELGEIIGQMFGQIPALFSELSKVRTEQGKLVHLRLSLSAFELALLPFEAAIAPNGFPGSGSPLFLQSNPPITLTREVRLGQPLPVKWNRPPRILFIFASPAGLAKVPAEQHLIALQRAINPWELAKDREDENLCEKRLLTVLREATLEQIREACAETEFTHVHILAHGAPYGTAGDHRYGLALCSSTNPGEIDVVIGERLASALNPNRATTEAGQSRPTVLSFATCDSANVGSVLTPGGSIAHELHAAGIPWVFASQFPLWMRASTLCTEVLYERLLEGADPRWILHELRKRLRVSCPETHDWASIVAYATVPPDFEEQLSDFRDKQTRSQTEAASKGTDERSVLAETVQPVSVLQSSITAGSVLGDYCLERELWSDPYARMFWAWHNVMRTGHMVQVLVEEWQRSSDLPDKLHKAVKVLAGAGFGESHLTPTRADCAILRRNEGDQYRLHFLVYDRPGGETADHWHTLGPQQFGGMPAEQARALLEFGAQVSRSLAEMHARNIPHGNLGPATVVVRSNETQQQAYLKDSWVWQCRPGHCAWPDNAPPEEERREQDVDELKRDCWGLGLVLKYVIGEGMPSPEGSISNVPTHLPEVLERVTLELLVPSPRLRPSAAFVRDRLVLARVAGGTYLGDFERILTEHIWAGHRLFAVAADDLDELETVLGGLVDQGHRLYVAREEVGLEDKRQKTVLVPWITAAQIDAELIGQARSQRLPYPPPMGEALAGSVNGRAILEFLAKMRCPAVEPAPVVLIRGARWWNYGPAGWRILRNIQTTATDSPAETGKAKAKDKGKIRNIQTTATDSPAVIVADPLVTLESDLARHFVSLPLPPPTPAALFEHILSFPEAKVSPDTAMELAEGLHPISRREATQCLRMCLHAYGVIDGRVVVIRDDTREELFQRIGILSYFPVAKLPAPETVGLAPLLEADLLAWVSHIRAEEDSESVNMLRRVLVWGPDGSGKTLVARSIARRLKRPLVRFDPENCLRGKLGESEEALRFALAMVSGLQRCVVLLDDIHRFFRSAAADPGAGALAATMQRMSGTLLHWLDHLPSGCVAVVTANAPETLLPDQWRWRIDKEFQLLSATDDEGQRQAIFAAVLHRHGLNAVAADEGLVGELAANTHPDRGIPNLASPSARAAVGPLRRHVSHLHSAADIANWVSETILLHSRAASPQEGTFWRAALVTN